MPPAWLRALAVIVASSFLATGCNTMYPRYMGIRPDSPEVSPTARVHKECVDRHGPDDPTHRPLLTACEGYLGHVDWAQQLAESYRTRATMNEWAIYAAGTIALGALAAVGGLGLAAAASVTTIGLIGVSSGFASSVFALADNKTRAGFYTVAANDIGSALADANKKVTGAPDLAKGYADATLILSDRVHKAANALEDKRYEAAAAAAAASKTADASKKLQEYADLAEKAAVVDVDPSAGPANAGQEVELKTKGIDDLKKYENDLKVTADGEPSNFEVRDGKLMVKMRARPDGKPRDVVLRLRLGPIPVTGQVVYRYQ